MISSSVVNKNKSSKLAIVKPSAPRRRKISIPIRKPSLSVQPQSEAPTEEPENIAIDATVIEQNESPAASSSIVPNEQPQIQRSPSIEPPSSDTVMPAVITRSPSLAPPISPVAIQRSVRAATILPPPPAPPATDNDDFEDRVLTVDQIPAAVKGKGKARQVTLAKPRGATLAAKNGRTTKISAVDAAQALLSIGTEKSVAVSEGEEFVITSSDRQKKTKKPRKSRNTKQGVYTIEEIEAMTIKELCNADPSRFAGESLFGEEKAKKKKRNIDDVDEPAENGNAARESTPAMVATSTAESSSSAPAPRVRIVNGKIILDESSLQVESASVPLSTTNLPTIEESHKHARYITSSSFRPPISTKRWSIAETSKFYNALRVFGTDFEMISRVFPARARREIKLKFKKEERANRKGVDDALKDKKTLAQVGLSLEAVAVDTSKIPAVIVAAAVGTSAESQVGPTEGGEDENMEADGSGQPVQVAPVNDIVEPPAVDAVADEELPIVEVAVGAMDEVEDEDEEEGDDLLPDVFEEVEDEID